MEENDSRIDLMLSAIKNDGGKVIRGYRSLPELRNEILSALSTGHSVAFALTNLGLRHFYNTAGFVSTLTKLISELPSVEVLVPPGAYGKQQRHIFAVGPSKA